MRRLSLEEAQAHIMARQGLVRLYESPLQALQGIFAVQTQYAASLPTALAFRVKNLAPAWHQTAEHRDVLKAWTLRSTLHAHTTADHALVLDAVGDRFYNRYLQWFQKDLGFSPEFIENMYDKVTETLADGPLTRAEIHERVPTLKQIPHAGWGLDLKGLAYLGRVKVIVKDGGATLFALHECMERRPKMEAIADLMRRYFFAFGPATLRDFRYWTGLFAADIAKAFPLAAGDLTEVEVEGWPGQRFMAGDLDLQAIPKVALLAKFDPLTLGHLDKTPFLPECDRTKVFRDAGQVEAGILIDGKFAGTWRLSRKGSGAEVVLDPFRRISKTRMPAIERQAKIAAKSLGLKLLGVRTLEK